MKKLLNSLLLSVFAISATLLLTVQSSASMSDADVKYFTIKSVQVKEISQPKLHMLSQPLCDSSMTPNPDNGSIRPKFDGIDLNEIINIGQKIWTIVEKNAPVVNLKVQTASAVPLGVKEWGELECWQVPESRVYRVTYTNLFGMTVVNIAFRVSYTYGGRINGQGRYLSQVTVLPAELDVAWGYRIDGEVRVANVSNAGTRAFPVAGIQMDVNWVIKTPLKYSESTESFYVRGDGAFKQLQ